MKLPGRPNLAPSEAQGQYLNYNVITQTPLRTRNVIALTILISVITYLRFPGA